ncbi:hypothetical protein CYLTODRAFT_494779 [Cylindrobasidium torrendii FP15055 ss-10]|uniref:Uncharacterized protein n=1 Tax=Cylindrobasidium torrendii FP15055 ss-10 TaxID=1314674 RepID=A0A0D7AW72_9AGAR|nr:hypothetical protein CYLTODRAFT_494779 [Cylindrobasidium torrendii FP15055 ss-10]
MPPPATYMSRSPDLVAEKTVFCRVSDDRVTTRPLLDFISRSERAANLTVELDLPLSDSSYLSSLSEPTYQDFIDIVAEAKRLLLRLEPESFEPNTLAFFTTLKSLVNQPSGARWVAAPHMQTLVLVFSTDCTSHLLVPDAPPELMAMVHTRTWCELTFKVEAEFQIDAAMEGVMILPLQNSATYRGFKARGVDIRVTKTQQVESNEEKILF